MSGSGDSAAQLEHPSKPTALRPGNVIIAPVTRDHRFQHYAPDRFSIVRTASSSAERFEIRLHSIVHREVSQQLAVVPGKEMMTVGRDIRIEVSEHAVIDLAWPQLILLRDELTRAIAGAAPGASDEAAQRLSTLTAQIALAEAQLTHLTWPPPPQASTPSPLELARLSDRISLLIDRLEPRPAVRRPPTDWSREKVVRPRGGRPNVKAYWAGAVVATILGLVAWAAVSEDINLWPRLWPASQPADSPPAVVSSSAASAAPTPAAAPAPSPAPPAAAKPVAAAPPSILVPPFAPVLTPETAPEPAPTPVAAPVPAPAPAPIAAPMAAAPVPPPPATPPAGRQEPPPVEAAAPPSPVTPATQPAAQTTPTPPPAITAPAAPVAAATPPVAPPVALLVPPLTEPSSRPAIAAPSQEPAAAEPGVAASAPAPHVAIHATAETWVRVRDAAGRSYISRVLKAGETWPVPAVAGLIMTTGNSGSTFIVVDGVTGPALGTQGVVRTEKLP